MKQQKYYEWKKENENDSAHKVNIYCRSSCKEWKETRKEKREKKHKSKQTHTHNAQVTQSFVHMFFFDALFSAISSLNSFQFAPFFFHQTSKWQRNEWSVLKSLPLDSVAQWMTKTEFNMFSFSFLLFVSFKRQTMRATLKDDRMTLISDAECNRSALHSVVRKLCCSEMDCAAWVCEHGAMNAVTDKNDFKSAHVNNGC